MAARKSHERFWREIKQKQLALIGLSAEFNLQGNI